MNCRENNRNSCFNFINRYEQNFIDVIMKPAFLFRGLCQLYEEQFGYSDIQNIPEY